jgi:uncharacterized protein with GYD domain
VSRLDLSTACSLNARRPVGARHDWLAIQNREEADMPTYVSLVSWTEQGIKNFPDTIRRAEEFARFVQGWGGKVRESLWIIGEYDLIQLSEFANDEKAFAAFLRLESAGNVRTHTMRAFNAKEMEAIIHQASVRMEHGSWG